MIPKITDAAVARFGRIDVLVNNAGLSLAKPFTDYTSGDVDPAFKERVVWINLISGNDCGSWDK